MLNIRGEEDSGDVLLMCPKTGYWLKLRLLALLDKAPYVNVSLVSSSAIYLTYLELAS
jgi:hypothetical protein